jgi:putative glycosyltransferase (TIGR04372 family)
VRAVAAGAVGDARQSAPLRASGAVYPVTESLLVASPRTHAFGLLVADTCVAAAVAEARSARLLWAAPGRQRARLLGALSFHGHGGSLSGVVLRGPIGQLARIAARLRTPIVADGTDPRRSFGQGDVRATLRTDAAKRARLRLGSLGLDVDRPMVAVHVRGYPPLDGSMYRAFIRGTEPATYGQCVEHLSELGYQTVQVGRETPSLPVTVAVPTDDADAMVMQLWSIANARFFLATDSGPYQLSWLLDVPCLHTNVVNLLGTFPLRAADRCVPKRLADRETGKELGLENLVTEEFWLGMTRKVRANRFTYVDASPGDLTKAVDDMLADLDNPRPPTASQAWYRERTTSLLLTSAMSAKILAKTGHPEVYIGEGRISRRFVEAHRHALVDG